MRTGRSKTMLTMRGDEGTQLAAIRPAIPSSRNSHDFVDEFLLEDLIGVSDQGIVIECNRGLAAPP
ncbi:hypothetical protein [Bradyrhizobium sp. 164]|uniref:hypothetical protein n=1 Tax=Bradyrhizobium sp. 164 TaxID=2782637 RepID=UPI001FF96CA3|nr:hypothetical protein [Bradyrhizobium sp. 164]MCK1593422.1 hypothetical protein [Bradyrhizobium sp. 164]